MSDLKDSLASPSPSAPIGPQEIPPEQQAQKQPENHPFYSTGLRSIVLVAAVLLGFHFIRGSGVFEGLRPKGCYGTDGDELCFNGNRITYGKKEGSWSMVGKSITIKWDDSPIPVDAEFRNNSIALFKPRSTTNSNEIRIGYEYKKVR